MRSFFDVLTGTYVVTLKGTRMERFLNVLTYHEVSLLAIWKGEEECLIRILRKDREQFLALASKYRIQVVSMQLEGAPAKCTFCQNNRSFFIGAIICFVFLLCMSQAIWKVEFQGNSYHTKEALLQYLEMRGIHYGTFRFMVSWEKEEVMLRKHFSDVAWCSMSADGSKLTVIITENPHITHKEKGVKGKNLVANHDAVISYMVTRTGTPLVKKGSRVKAGDILVEGRIQYFDDAGQKLSQKKVCADADVKGRYPLPVEIKIPKRWKKTVFSEERTGHGILVGENYIGLKMNNPKNTNIDVLTEYHTPDVLNRLPYKGTIVKQTGFRREEKEHLNSEKEGRTMLFQKRNRLYKKLQRNKCKIIEKNVHIEDNSREVVLKGTLLIEETFTDYQ